MSHYTEQQTVKTPLESVNKTTEKQNTKKHTRKKKKSVGAHGHGFLVPSPPTSPNFIPEMPISSS
jgi:hypothetical protein